MSALFPLKPLRPLTPIERGFVDRLLTADFPGRDQIAQQLSSALGRQIDNEASFELKTTSLVRAPVIKRVPVEGEGPDIDGVPIYFLLHVVDSMVKELEIYKADGSPIRQLPNPDEVAVIVLPP
jgi:hypothetical protein